MDKFLNIEEKYLSKVGGEFKPSVKM